MYFHRHWCPLSAHGTMPRQPITENYHWKSLFCINVTFTLITNMNIYMGIMGHIFPYYKHEYSYVYYGFSYIASHCKLIALSKGSGHFCCWCTRLPLCPPTEWFFILGNSGLVQKHSSKDEKDYFLLFFTNSYQMWHWVIKGITHSSRHANHIFICLPTGQQLFNRRYWYHNWRGPLYGEVPKIAFQINNKKGREVAYHTRGNFYFYSVLQYYSSVPEGLIVLTLFLLSTINAQCIGFTVWF